MSEMVERVARQLWEGGCAGGFVGHPGARPSGRLSQLGEDRDQGHAETEYRHDRRRFAAHDWDSSDRVGSDDRCGADSNLKPFAVSGISPCRD